MKRTLIFLTVFCMLLSFGVSIAEENVIGFAPLTKGDSGEAVTVLQNKLKELGYMITDEEGVFGSSTKNALFMYQTENGLEPSGSYDENTYKYLYGLIEKKEENEETTKTVADDTEPSWVVANPHLREEPRAGEIATAKSRLWVLGYDCGNTNGEADATFQEQILKYQKDFGLPETGICDYQTRQSIETQVSVPKLFPVLREDDTGRLLFGMIDAEGQMVIPAEYSRYSFGDGIIRLSKLDADGFFASSDFFYSDGTPLVLKGKPNGDFEEGFLVVDIDGKDCMVNTAGEVAIPNNGWSWVYWFDDGLAEVRKDGRWGFIDAAGNQVVDCTYSDSVDINSRGEGWYSVNNRGYFNAFDPSLSIAVPDDQNKTAILGYSEGYCSIMHDNRKTRVYDVTGKEAFPYEWDGNNLRFVHGLAVVWQGDLCGYINYNGECVSGMQYTAATRFNDSGYASVQLEGSEHYIVIDQMGNNPWPEVWSEKAIQFNNGMAKIVQDGKVGFIDLTGEMIIPLVWDVSEIEESGYSDTNKTGLYPYADIKGFFAGFVGDLAPVARDDRTYYINRDGEVVAYAGPSTLIPTYAVEERKTPTTTLKSETECKTIAIDYLKKYLKNPDSLQVHSATATMSGVEYTFIIDYSAMNSFGGYTRSSYICVVNCLSGEVTAAYSSGK